MREQIWQDVSEKHEYAKREIIALVQQLEKEGVPLFSIVLNMWRYGLAEAVIVKHNRGLSETYFKMIEDYIHEVTAN